MRSSNTLESFDELRLALLSAEKSARDMVGDYENRYAKAHLREVSAFMTLGLAQIEYARLAANNPPDRTDHNPVKSLTEVWTEITVYGDAHRIFVSDDGRKRTEPHPTIEEARERQPDPDIGYYLDENMVIVEGGYHRRGGY